MTSFIPVLIGLLTGTLVGASAIGSGSLVTPLLLLLTPVPAGAAIGTSLALASLTKLAGFAAHRQQGNVHGGLSAWLIAGALPGAVLAGLLLERWQQAVSAAQMRSVVGVLLMALALVLLLASARSVSASAEASEEEPGAPAPLPGRTRLQAFVVGGVVALVVTLTSVGSGGLLLLVLLLWTPACTRSASAWLGKLVGTTTVYGLAATLLGGAAHLVMRNVDPALLALLAAGSIPGVLVGSRLTRWIPERYYQAGIGGLNLLLGLRLAWGA